MSAAASPDDLVVAPDGTGDYTTVQAAIHAVGNDRTHRTRIYLKAGVYKEKINLTRNKHAITLVGEDRDTTILTFDDHAVLDANGDLTGTGKSPSVMVKADDFAAENVTFANTAGAVGPAIALWVIGDRAHFRNCAFRGYQDTLCLTGHEAFFRDCEVEGAIDFIFGSSTAIFHDCAIDCLDAGYITAASTDPSRPYGFVFKQCVISGVAPAGSVYLGRPWTDYANVVYLACTMDAEIASDGWLDWNGVGANGTAFYAEYNSAGKGADPAERVRWSHQLAADDLAKYTLPEVFGLTSTGTPWYKDF